MKSASTFPTLLERFFMDRLMHSRRMGCAGAIHERYRQLVADGAVRTNLVVVSTPMIHLPTVSSSVRNLWAFRHSARNLPLNDSMNELSVGLPGRENSSTTSFW